MPGITLTGVKKKFDAIEVLKGVDLAIHEGEFLTLVGPSGCGKSTLLRIIAGLEAPDAGTVRLADRDVTELRAAERDLAMVFQSYALYPHLSVAQNMATPLKLRQLNRAGRLPFIGPVIARTEHLALQKKVHEVAEVLQIEALLNRKPGQLSGGQRQRVALGRAMVRDPAAFLMDEPLSNLDAALRVHMRTELSELHRRLGRTFIYVTHDQAEALTMSDRMAVMMEGQILQLGTPAEIYSNPQDIRVATFVGSPQINLIPGESNAQGEVSCAGYKLRRRLARTERGPVTVGLRPEHLRLAHPDERDTIIGRLGFRENLGADTFLHLTLADNNARLVLRVTSAEAARLDPGAFLHVVQARGEALVFGTDGRRRTLSAESHPQQAFA